MLYECTVNSVSDYGSEAWGFENRDAVDKIHLRAARSFLGLPKHATSVGVMAEINWLTPVYRAHVNMVRHYFRLQKMENGRLAKLIYNWDVSFSEYNNLDTWSSEIKSIFETNNLLHYFQNQNICTISAISKLKESLFLKQTVELKNKCLDKPKLRTFVTFKDFGSIACYLTMPMSFIARKFLALTRLSNLGIRLETGRYERPRLKEHLRLCPACLDRVSVENENHVLFFCRSYEELRQPWLQNLEKPQNFMQLETSEKLKIVFNESSNVKSTAQFIIDLYDIRSKIVNK